MHDDLVGEICDGPIYDRRIPDFEAHKQGVWKREGKFFFDSTDEYRDMLYDVATMELHDVPIGWAILSVWCEVEGCCLHDGSPAE